MAFLNRSETSLRVGDLMRNMGDGSTIMQVKDIEGRRVLLISAGKIARGWHKPPIRSLVVEGVKVIEEPYIVWTGKGEPKLGKIGSAYIKVTCDYELEGLALPVPM